MAEGKLHSSFVIRHGCSRTLALNSGPENQFRASSRRLLRGYHEPRLLRDGGITLSENNLSTAARRSTVTGMKRAFFLVGIIFAMNALGTVPGMYHEGWVDFNKNGVKDIYEDPAQPVEKRVADLIAQMSLEEKIGQLHQTPSGVGEEKISQH